MPQPKQFDAAGDVRRGFTLIELLVVMVILLLITAITIPVVAPAVQGRQVREAARMLSTFLNAARNRALESGRPAGVWIERRKGLPEVSTSVYFAEVPPAYAGDYLDSTVETFVVNGVPTSPPMNGTIFDWPRVDSTCRDYWNIVIPRSRTTFNCDAWASPNPRDQQIVRAGDQILLEGSDRRIPLKIVEMNITGASSASSEKSLYWYIYRGRNCASNTGPDGGYTGERHWSGEFVIRWFDRMFNVHWESIRRTTFTPFNPAAVGLKYKIYRQPIKLQAGSITLPEGTVIDLNYSSITNGTTSDSGIPFHPRRDPSDNNNNSAATWYWGDPIYPQDETPILIVFSAGGHVERIYCHVRENNTAASSTAAGQWVWDGYEPFGQIHFLVGRLDKIVSHEQYRISQAPAQNLEIQTRKNWLDLDNLWVTVQPQSGLISTAIVDNVSQTAYATQAVNPANLHLTRAKARESRVIGGR